MSSSHLDGIGIIAPPPALYLGTLALALLAQVVLAWPSGLPAAWMYGGGVVCLLLSGGFARWAFVTLEQGGTSASLRRESQALTTGGPFALSRNPIYVAMTGLYVGIGLLMNSLWPFLLLPVLLLVMQYGVVLREEVYLTRRFGDSYLAYQARTRRWL